MAVPLTETRPVVRLHPREYDVLRELMADGPSNEQIAERLGIAKDTVKTHMKGLLRKAGYDNRTALALAALRRRFIIRVWEREWTGKL